MTGDRDPVLAPWCMAAAAAIEREIARWAPVPDLADVLARARAEDPAAVPADWRGLDERDAAIVPLSRRRALTQELPDAGLAMFAVALRDRVEGDLHERGLAEIPTPVRRRSRVRPFVAAALALAAAVVIGVLALPRFVAERSESFPTASAARTLQPGLASAWRQVKLVRPRASAPTVVPPPMIDPPRIEPPVVEPPVVASPRGPRGPSLDELEREVDVRWRSGDIAGAETLLRKIIARAGKGARAELAYGDLFALARQRRGKDGPVAEWKAYLQRFPRGRFAEDARAGLCRHAADADEAERCWASYLRHHPAGSHAAEARRWTPSP